MTDEQNKILNSTRLRLTREHCLLSSKEENFSKKVTESTPFSGAFDTLSNVMTGVGGASGVLSFGSFCVAGIASMFYGAASLEYAAEATPMELNKLADAVKNIFAFSADSFKVVLVSGGVVFGLKAIDEVYKRLTSDFEAMGKLQKVREDKKQNEEFQRLVNELINDKENEELEYAREYLQTVDLSGNDAKTNFEIIKCVLKRSVELAKIKKMDEKIINNGVMEEVIDTTSELSSRSK